MKKRIFRIGICVLFSMTLFCVASNESVEIISDDKADVWSYSADEQTDRGDIWSLIEHIAEQNVSIDGKRETEEFPYGYNVGKIQDDTVGSAVLITPGTSIEIKNYKVSEDNAIQVESEIHPWVADKSDGATLNVDIISDGENFKCSYDLTGESGLQIWNIPLDKYVNTDINIQIYVTNKEEKSEVCDWVILKEFSIVTDQKDINVQKFSETGYIKSATYFSEEWPANFWNSESDDITAEFKQIRKDGFDSIILVIPWRKFQPDIFPIAYNEYAFEKLDEVMKEAEKAGLGVYARIGYTWDFYDDVNENIVDRYCQLLGDETVQEAWYAYVEKMYDTLSQYSCFRQGFLTWEDFWNTLGVCDEILEINRRNKAEFIGYQAWVRTNYSLAEYNENFGTEYRAYDEVPVPKRNEPAMRAMYEFYDDFLNTILKNSQVEFPNLSMEVRMDWDVVYTKDGETDYYKHTGTFACADSSYTATMYGIPMGFKNVGERVSYEEALEKTEYILQQLKLQNDDKSVYVEQFIFADNTPKFKDNAQIKEEELNLYLENVAPVLLNNTEGYGIWTYRNYCANMIYNSQFALSEKGWECSDGVKFLDVNDSNACVLEEGQKIAQRISNVRNHFDADYYTVEFEVLDVAKAGELYIKMGNNLQKLYISEPEKVSVDIKKGLSFDIEIASDDCTVVIDNLKMYSQIQQGYLYDENNKELECISGIRKLNEMLQ